MIFYCFNSNEQEIKSYNYVIIRLTIINPKSSLENILMHWKLIWIKWSRFVFWPSASSLLNRLFLMLDALPVPACHITVTGLSSWGEVSYPGTYQQWAPPGVKPATFWYPDKQVKPLHYCFLKMISTWPAVTVFYCGFFKDTCPCYCMLSLLFCLWNKKTKENQILQRYILTT